ncbi:glycosyl transferase family protein [Rhodopirellula europaea SH398]|uniref:Glycosyl transferase family protein n=2 Tax=Rhodopirellula TaxID=265488 RepID=M5SB46_9BACT|nr:glycosyl transferase family protein [Rhodopirellula europaea SH398]
MASLSNVRMTLLHLATFAFWALIGFATVNALCTTITLVALFRHRRERSDDRELPRVAILLCLRGADPQLAGGLRRLMNQQYPDYEIFIVIDSETDPAWGVVKQSVDDAGGKSAACQVHISTLRQRLETCSLKCSSLVQLLDQIDDSFEVVVLADSDLESHPTWLRELVAPLDDPRVGAAFGNRWFLPAAGWMGSLVRQVCNAIGVVTMHLGQIPWGGSLAIRASVVQESGLRETLTRSIVDDGPVRVALREQGLKLQFVPSLLMANREDCDLRFAHNFLTRQLKWTQTYMSSQWPIMLVYTLGVLGIYMVTVVLAVVCALAGFHEEAVWFAVGAATYSGTVMTLWFLLDVAARRIIRAQGEPVPGFFGVQLLKLPIAMLLAVVIHVSAMVRASVLRRVIWRGVTYEVLGPNEVYLLNEQAMEASLESANVSL